MTGERKIRRALLSVSDKTGLVAFARALAADGRRADLDRRHVGALRAEGLPVKDVSELTGFPEMLDGRVKTLHPKVHGGLLAVRGNAEHERQAAEHGIAPIDLLVVNLYPFEATVAKGARFDECIENIDIGGPALIRAAAKNHAGVTVIVEPDDYERVLARDARERRRDDARPAPAARRQGLRPHRRLRRRDRQLVCGDAGRRGAGVAGVRAASARRRCATARTRISRRPSMSPATRASAWRRPCSTRARSSPTTTSTTRTRPTSWWRSSARAGPAVAIIKHANPCGAATAALAEGGLPRRRCAAIRSAPSAASSRSTAPSTPRQPRRSPRSSPRW